MLVLVLAGVAPAACHAHTSPQTEVKRAFSSAPTQVSQGGLGYVRSGVRDSGPQCTGGEGARALFDIW